MPRFLTLTTTTKINSSVVLQVSDFFIFKRVDILLFVMVADSRDTISLCITITWSFVICNGCRLNIMVADSQDIVLLCIATYNFLSAWFES